MSFYYKMTENDLRNSVREFVTNFKNGIGEGMSDKKTSGSSIFFVVPNRTAMTSKKKMELLEQIEENTNICFNFLENFIKFITENSSQLLNLKLDEVIIGTAIDEVLLFWCNNFIMPNVPKFTLEAIDSICKKLNDFQIKYGIFLCFE